jgi:hypothetical protein
VKGTNSPIALAIALRKIDDGSEILAYPRVGPESLGHVMAG